MASVPYFLQLNAVLGAAGTGTLSFTVPKNEGLQLRQVRFSSTGAFNVTDIRDSAGQHYTNASSANPIPSTELQNAASANIGIQALDIELNLVGGVTFYVDLVDTSGAGNTVRVLFTGVRELP